MTVARKTLNMLGAGVMLALACVGSAAAGPVPITTWDSGAPAAVAQPEPLANGQVLFGATPTLLGTARLGDFVYALVLQTPQLRDITLGPEHAEQTGRLGRGHLFLMRRRIDDVDALRPWERVGGQIDEMDPAQDGRHADEAGVQSARLSCNVYTLCRVAYTVRGRLTLARPVTTEGRFSWQRAHLAAAGDHVGELALSGWADQGYVGWAQLDLRQPDRSTIRLAELTWEPGRDLEIKRVVSFGPGDRLQLIDETLMVDDDREIRGYDVINSLNEGAPALLFRLERAQPTGRVLLSASPRSGWLVVEPAPGGILVHEIDFYGRAKWRYRLNNPDWLPAGAVPMALTANTGRGWLVVGAPGQPGRHALVEITANQWPTLGARVYQLPNLPPPAGYRPDQLPIVIPEVIGAIDTTHAGSPPTLDLLTTATLIGNQTHTDQHPPIGHTALLAERITTRPASN